MSRYRPMWHRWLQEGGGAKVPDRWAEHRRALSNAALLGMVFGCSPLCLGYGILLFSPLLLVPPALLVHTWHKHGARLAALCACAYAVGVAVGFCAALLAQYAMASRAGVGERREPRSVSGLGCTLSRRLAGMPVTSTVDADGQPTATYSFRLLAAPTGGPAVSARELFIDHLYVLVHRWPSLKQPSARLQPEKAWSVTLELEAKRFGNWSFRGAVKATMEGVL